VDPSLKTPGAEALLQQGYQTQRPVQYFHALQPECLSVVAYRSVAVGIPTDDAVRAILTSAQSRNKAEGLTGVLVYDRGAYFQWLEGPTEALRRVWDSICSDTRHRHITILRDEPVSDRLFDGWDLRVAHGPQVSVEAAVGALNSSPASLKRAIGNPQSIVQLSLSDIFSTIVLPRLREVHGPNRRAVRFDPTAGIWHAEVDSGTKLASVLIAPRSEDCRRYVDSLLEQGANFNALYHEVFEPAQLQLGRLWDDERCDDFHLAIGLARMQMELRRVNAAVPADRVTKPQHSVLLSAQPSEPHCVGLVMSSEVFDRKGWEVDCEFPTDDRSLNDRVHEHWFDVLKLSQSGCLRRDNRLAAMRTTIDSVRAASLNPSLIVMVDGRTFDERPQIYRAVHAHAMGASVLDAVSVAERLLAATRSLTAQCQVDVA
jgi:methanogenic corrinoid protein MtbC1